MPIEMALWRLDGDNAAPVAASALEKEERLEAVLEQDIGILGLGQMLVIGRQVVTRWGKKIDLLAINGDGDLYAIELKRDRTPREVVAQVLDYGSWVRDLGYDDLVSIYEAYGQGGDFQKAQELSLGQAPEDINASHHLVVVASELDASTERIVEYLNDSEIPINVVFFRYLQDEDREYLARSWLVDPVESEERTTRKKRPWNGRDFYISFGEGEHDSRRWEDAMRYGFVSGGGQRWYSRTLFALQPGHRVFVNLLPKAGYVGTGHVLESAQPVKEFKVNVDGKEVSLSEAPDLQASNMTHHIDDPDRCEYAVRIKWDKVYPREHAFWERGLFANQNTATKLRDEHTIRRLEEHFGVSSAE